MNAFRSGTGRPCAWLHINVEDSSTVNVPSTKMKSGQFADDDATSVLHLKQDWWGVTALVVCKTSLLMIWELYQYSSSQV